MLTEHAYGRVQAILEPLAIAANVTQASHTRLDHVLITLGNLFRIYTNEITFDEASRNKILSSLETRWAAADQDIFIAGVFLNPYIRGRIFKRAVLTLSAMYDLVERVFERVYSKKADLFFFLAFTDYEARKEEFSDAGMNLDKMAELYQREVREQIHPVSNFSPISVEPSYRPRCCMEPN